MRFARTDRPREDEILRCRDPLATRECMNLRRTDALSGREIEAVQGLDFGKPRLAEPLRSLARVIERTGGLARVTYAEASDLIDLVPVLAGGEA